MRIDLYESGVVPVAGTRAVPSAPATAQSSLAAVPEDSATLSSAGLSSTSLASQALRSAEAREGKVEALRQAIGSGAYTLDPALIAEAMQSEGI